MPNTKLFKTLGLLQIGFVIFVTIIAYLDLLPHHWLDFPYSDKILHFTLFGLVTFWLNLWWQGRRWHGWPLAILLPFIFIFIEEGLQTFSPNRTADGWDLLFDIGGMVCLWWLSEQLLRQVAGRRLPVQLTKQPINQLEKSYERTNDYRT